MNKYPSYDEIDYWVSTLNNFRLDTVYFSVFQKPRIILKCKIKGLVRDEYLRCLIPGYSDWGSINEPYFSGDI